MNRDRPRQISILAYRFTYIAGRLSISLSLEVNQGRQTAPDRHWLLLVIRMFMAGMIMAIFHARFLEFFNFGKRCGWIRLGFRRATGAAQIYRFTVDLKLDRRTH